MYTLEHFIYAGQMLIINLLIKARLQICKHELKSNPEPLPVKSVKEKVVWKWSTHIPGNLLGLHETVNQLAAKFSFQQ